jgi:hypothetical protein
VPNVPFYLYPPGAVGGKVSIRTRVHHTGSSHGRGDLGRNVLRPNRLPFGDTGHCDRDTRRGGTSKGMRSEPGGVAEAGCFFPIQTESMGYCRCVGLRDSRAKSIFVQ